MVLTSRGAASRCSLVLLVVVVGVALAPQAAAAPALSDLTVLPAAPWLGNPVTLTAICTDGIVVTGYLTGPSTVLPPFNFTPAGTSYSLVVNPFYLTKTGTYTASIVCTKGEENVTASIAFTVSVLTGQISSVSPSFLGEDIQIGFFAFKDGIALQPPAAVSFEVKVGGATHPLLQAPYFDAATGWVLRVASPTVAGTQDVQVTASYDGASVTNHSTTTVKSLTEVDLVTVSDTLLEPNQEIVLTVKANEKGSPATLQASQLDLRINDVVAPVTNVSLTGGLFTVRATVPSLVPGSYTLSLQVVLGNATFSLSKPVAYAQPVSGEIVDEDGSPVALTLTFTANGTVTTVETDSAGRYDLSLSPGTYDIRVEQGKSSLAFSADIGGFDDDIRFYKVTGPIPGITVSGAYVAEVSIPHGPVTLTLEYADVDNELGLKVFQCAAWTGTCETTWSKLQPEVNIAKNLATVTVSSLSAFAVGTEQSLQLEASLDQDTYQEGETVTLTGALLDGNDHPIAGVAVAVTLNGQDAGTATSAGNGWFSVELFPPGEGAYSVTVTPQPPYAVDPVTLDFSVEKSKELFILSPDAIRLSPGDSRIYDFVITNIGQAHLNQVTVSLSGIPDGIATVPAFSGPLPPGEERRLSVTFTVPADAAVRTYSGKITVTADGVQADGIFSFSVLEVVEVQEPARGFEFPSLDVTGNAVALVSPHLGWLFAVGIGAFLLAMVVRRRNRAEGQRAEVTHLLNDIKREIMREEKA